MLLFLLEGMYFFFSALLTLSLAKMSCTIVYFYRFLINVVFESKIYTELSITIYYFKKRQSLKNYR